MNESASAVPKVSVIIPLYNKAPYIKRALDSVLAQTVQDFEIVVVNDGSTDGGEKIVEELNDSRIRLINQKNQGVSAARNNGVDAAKAELVAFLDADDEWLPEFLETILRLREKWPDAGLYGTAWYDCVTNPFSTNIDNTILKPSTHVNRSPYYHAALTGLFPICASTVVFPKNIFLNMGGFNQSLHCQEDPELFAKTLLYYSLAYCPHNLAIYYHNSSNVSSNLESYKFLEDGHPFQKYLMTVPKELIDTHPYKDDLLLYVESLYIMQAYGAIANNHKSSAKKYLSMVKNKKLLKRKMNVWYVMLPNNVRKAISRTYHLIF